MKTTEPKQARRRYQQREQYLRIERSTWLLNESWDYNELWDARHCLVAIYESVDVNLTADRMNELAARGLLHDVIRLPGRGRYANRFTFQWCDKLETLVRAALAAGFYSPNKI